MESKAQALHEKLINQLKSVVEQEKIVHKKIGKYPDSLFWNSQFGEWREWFFFQDEQLEVGYKVDNSPSGYSTTGLSKDDLILWLMIDKEERDLGELNELLRKNEGMAMIPPSRLFTPQGSYQVIDTIVWDPYVLGDTFCSLNKIRIRHDNGEKQVTLMHEIMHVATKCDQDRQLHRAIQQMAPELLQLLKDNPDVVSYLTRK